MRTSTRRSLDPGLGSATARFISARISRVGIAQQRPVILYVYRARQPRCYSMNASPSPGIRDAAHTY